MTKHRLSRKSPPSKFPQALAIAQRREQHLWQLADALLAELGKPPKSFAASLRRIENEFDEGVFDDCGGVKGAARMWRVADAFPPATRMRADQTKHPIGMRADIFTHIKAGSPEVLRAVLTSSPRSGRALLRYIKVMKQAVAMQADEEGYLRKRRARQQAARERAIREGE
jgi:hypothetical protein